MPVKTRKNPTQLESFELREDIEYADRALVVDREKQIIYNPKLLGFISRNGRRYTEQACRKALPLYENVVLNFGHLPKGKSEGDRAVSERFGRAKGVYLGKDGIYAREVHYYKSNPQTEMVLEEVEKNLGCFGFSHQATGSGRKIDGIQVIEQINSVDSLDVVCDPASVKSFKESIDMSTDTASAAPSLEEAFMMLQNAVMAGSKDDTEKMANLKKVLKLKSDLTGAPDTSSGDSSPPLSSGATESFEGKSNPPDKVLLENSAYKLAGKMGIPPEEELIESLVSLGSEDKMESHLEWLKRKFKTSIPARSAPSYQLKESSQVSVPVNDTKALGAFLRS